MNPNEPAWNFCRGAGWDPQVRQTTMVLTENIYDNIVVRSTTPDDAPPPGMPGHEILLEHPEIENVRARVEVVRMSRILDNMGDGILDWIGRQGFDPSKNRTQDGAKKLMQDIFHGSVSDHLPVRMRVLLPREASRKISEDDDDGVRAVKGVNISVGTSTTAGMSRYRSSPADDGRETESYTTRSGRSGGRFINISR